MTLIVRKHNRIDMDKITALKIMGLGPTASFAEAKKAYRNLAKQYHPDVAGKGSCLEREAESRMKEINRAFCYLGPLLSSRVSVIRSAEKKEDPKTVKPEPVGVETRIFSSFLSRLSGLAANFFNHETNGRPVKKKAGAQKAPGASKARTIHFETVFKTVTQIRSTGKTRAGMLKKKPYSKKNIPYNGYQHYMDLKRKMNSGQPVRHQEMSIGRIERIKAVKPVGKS